VKRNETNVTPIDQTRPDQNNTSNGDEQQPPSAAGAAGFDFESIYREYPRHKGKTRGLKHCKARIKTSLQFDRLKSAVATYAAECRLKGTEEDYIKQFDTFMGCWQDFVPPTVLPSDGNGSTHSTIADPLVREIVERDARRKAEYDKDPEGYMQRKLAALRDGTL
jgi:hypothetical protein